MRAVAERICHRGEVEALGQWIPHRVRARVVDGQHPLSVLEVLDQAVVVEDPGVEHGDRYSGSVETLGVEKISAQVGGVVGLGAGLAATLLVGLAGQPGRAVLPDAAYRGQRPQLAQLPGGQLSGHGPDDLQLVGHGAADLLE